MAPPPRVVPIKPCQSDGDSSKWPGPEKGLTRSDTYLLERVANDKWARDLTNAERGAPVHAHTWQLDRLPQGYAGFEKKRPGTTHVDRYVYGHPNGIFRSIAEFYPHFKHLMDTSGPVGCICKLCSGNRQRASYGGGSSSRNGSTGNHSVSPARPRPAAAKPKLAQPAVPRPNPSTVTGASSSSTMQPPRGRLNGSELLPQGRLPSHSPPRKRQRQVDEENTPDIYRSLLDKLQAGGEGFEMDEPIIEQTSADWRAGNTMGKSVIKELKSQPRYIPRAGELVMFVRVLDDDETLAWDLTLGTWSRFNLRKSEWVDPTSWEAGVVTEVPTEPIEETDLTRTASNKSSFVNSGFRIEPLPEPGSVAKHHSKRHCYVPLHALRPMALWRECLASVRAADYRATVRHALMTSCTATTMSKTRFRGKNVADAGPSATVFCRGAYLGPEFILIGDTVRLLPHPQEQPQTAVADILVITAIKLRLVNIRQANDNDYDDGRPYNTCLHFSGHAFTLDSARSYDSIGKRPLPTNTPLLPPGVSKYGTWYHVHDPSADPATRQEIPFTRILGRLPEHSAMKSWFTPPQIPNAAPPKPSNLLSVSTGLPGIFRARAYALENDPRIERDLGKTWMWADTRVEALDLWEVNGKWVGLKDDMRAEALKKFRKGIHVNGAQADAARLEPALPVISERGTGMMASSGGAGAAVEVSGSGSEEESDHDVVDGTRMGDGTTGGNAEEEEESGDDEVEYGAGLPGMNMRGQQQTTTKKVEMIELSDDEDT
nr:hypothetical protein B0A51_17449 [Rachicladosporium sp. CCFEE 5018]